MKAIGSLARLLLNHCKLACSVDHFYFSNQNNFIFRLFVYNFPFVHVSIIENLEDIYKHIQLTFTSGKMLDSFLYNHDRELHTQFASV